MTAAIEAVGAGVRFQFDRDQRPLTPALARLRRGVSESWGLREVTFAAGPGEAIALVGPSGSGKSTLLRLIAGVFTPDAGRIEVRGGVGTLLATDAGLMGALTGRENAAMIGVLAGLSRAEARTALDDVGREARLGPAFDRPVMSYSEGMRARVGFAAAMEADPEIVLLDEVHEALDHEYREVVEHRTRGLLERGGIVVAAGHDHPLLERICTRALLLDRGAIVADGAFSDVQRIYLSAGSDEV